MLAEASDCQYQPKSNAVSGNSTSVVSHPPQGFSLQLRNWIPAGAGPRAVQTGVEMTGSGTEMTTVWMN